MVSWPARRRPLARRPSPHREAAQPRCPNHIPAPSGAPSSRSPGAACDDRIVHLAADLGKASHAELVGVHVVEVGFSMPLDADIASRSDEAQQILDHAELQAEQRKARLEPVLLQAREVGAALVDEATERDADLLVVGLPVPQALRGRFRDRAHHSLCAEARAMRGLGRPRADPGRVTQVPVAAGGRKEAR